MRRLTVTLAVWLLASPAFAASLEATYQKWDQLRSPDTGAIKFEDGRDFLTNHPGWPEEKVIRLRTETAAFVEMPSKAVMTKFCTDFAPISGRGMIACATAQAGSGPQQMAWVKQGWLQGDFNEDEEEKIHTRYQKWLTAADETARMERLLYEGSTKAAKRQLSRVGQAKQTLYKARIAFSSNDPHSPNILATLSAADKADAGVIFDRLRWRMEHTPDADLAELLLRAPNDVPFPDLWWPMRATAARDAIGKGRYDTALAVLQHAGDIKGEALADALWMKGWIHLRHKDEAGAAYKEFFKLYTSVYTPVSKARAAYWAGRAAEANGNKDIAGEWMGKAARHPTVFYGQLAYHWLHGDKPLPLPEPVKVSDSEKKKLADDEMAVIARNLAKAGDDKGRDKFLSALAARATNEVEFAALTAFAVEIGDTSTGVEIAKIALRNGIVLMPYGWPTIEVPKGLPIEPALTLAITRQESEFNPEARSPANARGLMQLLPGTAKQMASKLDMTYRDSMLENPATNMTLGSNYLGRIIDGFDGSYILGIASYNAGPSNVRKWIALRGTPSKDPREAIDWIESISFGETRNYVMRAIENVNVYRTLANPQAPIMIEKDLVR